MSKFDRKKIAITLAFASLFGNKTSATNSNINTKSANKSGFSTDQIKNSKSGAEISKPLGTLNIRDNSSGNGIFNWVKNHKAVSIAAPLLIVGAVGLTIWGVKHKSKDNQNPDEQNPDEQNPGGPKSNEQDPNKKKDNEQKPPIKDNANPPKQVTTRPDPNITSGPQNNDVADQILSEHGMNKQFVAQHIGMQNVDKFIFALQRAKENGIKFDNDHVGHILQECLPLVERIVGGGENNVLANFVPLAKLKERSDYFLMFEKSNGNYPHPLRVFMGNLLYTICDFGSEQYIYFDMKNNDKYESKDLMIIKNNKLERHGLQ